MRELLKIRPYRETDAEVLSKVAAADNHSIIAPTFVVEKGPQIVGYIGTVPSVLIWMDQDRTSVRDSLMVQNFYENMLAGNNAQIIAVPCKNDSPYFPYMEKAGYIRADQVTLFFKNLNS